jgi:signal transduction histidine kinase
MGVEVALAFGAGAASFALAAVTVVAVGSGVWVFVLAVLYAAAIVAMFRRLGVEYAVPAAVAVLLAYDWYYVPPTHSHGFPDAADVADLVLYLVAGVLIGELAAHASRRADVSESARSELAEEQAALRRVATLVARGESPDAVFASVAEEAGILLDLDGARIVRFLGDDEILQLEGWTPPGHDRLPVGPLKLEHPSLSGEVLRTGHAVRIDDYGSVGRVIPWFWKELGIRSGIAAPILLDGRLWGAIMAWSLQSRSLPENAESRLAGFTELVATAISNTASREELALLARGQAALRRVATLVARGVPPSDMFATVSQELGLLLGVNATHIARYERDGTVTGVGGWSADGGHVSVGTRVSLDDTSVTSLVFATGRPARMDSYDDASAGIADLTAELGIRSAVGAPVVVDGDLWGAVIASSNDPQPLAADTESRIAAFTELVAAALSNAEARVEVGRLAEEQAALRRVATLVARQGSSTEVFTKVAEEVGRLLGAESAWMLCYEPENNSTLVAMWGELNGAFRVGMQLSVDGDNVAARVRRTWRTARIDDYAGVSGALGAHARETGVRSAVGSPIVVEGRLWGSMTAVTLGAELLPADAESRLEEFTELVATSISNMQARSDLAASRARIVAAADEERRRVVRDLHDGAQQRLVHTVVTLKLAQRALEEDPGGAAPALEEALTHAEQATAELRELAHGILPSVLTRGGLRAGVGALASRMPVPVDIGVSVERLPLAVEATAYFIVAEALTNVAKHSHANRAAVTARIEDGTLQVQVRDDGIGGAQPDGSGLLGLGDRLAALEGSLRVESPVDGGTLIAAAIPFR